MIVYPLTSNRRLIIRYNLHNAFFLQSTTYLMLLFILLSLLWDDREAAICHMTTGETSTRIRNDLFRVIKPGRTDFLIPSKAVFFFSGWKCLYFPNVAKCVCNTNGSTGVYAWDTKRSRETTAFVSDLNDQSRQHCVLRPPRNGSL